jgi:5'-methylthioinosine phosphorylase
MTSRLAIIGGSGLDELVALQETGRTCPATPYGAVSAPLIHGYLGDQEIVFLARHGSDHTIPPHRINYRANIWALANSGISDVFAVTAVGGIASTTPPGRIVVPDQIIDYTAAREHTFFDGIGAQVNHIDFTYPFTEALRRRLIDAAARESLTVEKQGTYGATEGPRLETGAEIARLARDGCTLVGMTGMPEAALAREAGLNYANCSLVVNWAAGVTEEIISLDEIGRQLEAGMRDVVRVLASAATDTR